MVRVMRGDTGSLDYSSHGLLESRCLAFLCSLFIRGSSCYSFRVNVQKGMQGNASGFEVEGDMIWNRVAWASVF